MKSIHAGIFVILSPCQLWHVLCLIFPIVIFSDISYDPHSLFCFFLWNPLLISLLPSACDQSFPHSKVRCLFSRFSLIWGHAADDSHCDVIIGTDGWPGPFFVPMTCQKWGHTGGIKIVGTRYIKTGWTYPIHTPPTRYIKQGHQDIFKTKMSIFSL